MTQAASPDLGVLARKHGIRLVLQFGSTVTGRTHPGSDLDLAVLLENRLDSLLAEGALAADLQACFPGQPVDLALLNNADPLLLQQIASHARLLYGSPVLFADWKVFAFKRFQDHRRFLDLERDYVRRTLAAPR